MPNREDDAVAPRDAAPANQNLLLTGGFALAGAATLAVLFTDNSHILKVAVIGMAWAFVLATFAAGRRDTDRVAAAAREAELRAAYEAELDREVAARREYELDLEHELRREAENAMRTELDALRGDIAALAALRGDLAALSGLREEVARVAGLRDDVAALMVLRQDLGQLAELRADMGRLRAELTEQLSSEMLVERIVMRTQASRLPAEAGRTDDGPGRAAVGGAGWVDDVPPRELTGGWPAVRLDEPRGTQHFEQVRSERPPPDPADGRRHAGWAPDPEPLPWDAPLPSWEPPAVGSHPATRAGYRHAEDQPAGPRTTMSEIAPASVARPPGPPPTTMSEIAPASIARPPAPPPRPTAPPIWQAPAVEGPPLPEERRPPLARPPVPPPVLPGPAVAPSPSDWLAARSSLDAPAPPSRPDVPPVRRRVPDVARDVRRSSAEVRTTHRPAAASPPARTDGRDGSRTASHDQAPAPTPGPARDNRLAEILAENGVSPSSGGRRRHRYRDGDEPDDVLARVLGQS
ncbi:MAG: DUF6779 domain-containing protein [Actinomycetes bacterium]